MDDKVNLNIGGTLFVTTKRTLKKIPNSKLARLNISCANYDAAKKEYYFDKNPQFFACILDTYRSGELHIPHCLCGPVVRNELQFWGIEERYISNCCWNAYSRHDQELKTFAALEKTLNGTSKEDTNQNNCNNNCVHDSGETSPTRARGWWFSRWKKALWSFLEDPKSSRAAQLWQILMFLLIVLSVAVVILSTHPNFRVSTPETENSTVTNETSTQKVDIYQKTDLHPVLDYLDNACLAFFALELILRFICCPRKLRFFASFFNVIDVACVIPNVAVALAKSISSAFWLYRNSIVLLSYLSITSVMRVFRLLKLANNYRVMRILILAIKSSLRELILLMLLIIMGMLIFSTFIYFAEIHEMQDFEHIPECFWWSIVTMTTVGYGDIVPESSLGYLIAALCAISGMLATGLPIPIIASNFIHYHTYDRIHNKLKERAKKRKNETLLQRRSRLQAFANSYSCFCCLVKPTNILTVEPVAASGSAVRTTSI